MNLFDVNSIVGALGLIGVLGLIFAEAALLVGLVLPGGDSLLFIAGVAASGSGAALLGGAQLPTAALFIGAPIAAIVGAQVGYWFGATSGRKLFDRPDGRFFNHNLVVTAEKWLSKYGIGRALVLARFVPVIRTLINPLCGIVKTPVRTFFLWNFIGGIIWTQGIIGLGFVLGERLKGSVDRYILPIVFLIIIASLLPLAIELFKEAQSKRHLSSRPKSAKE